MTRVGDKLGIDATRPIVVDGPQRGTLTPPVADPESIATTGAGWVRLHFVLGPWSEPLDSTRYQGRDWLGTYRSIIDRLKSMGLRIYGLIGHEMVQTDPGDRFRLPPEGMQPGDAQAANQWIQTYVSNFVVIVRQFRTDIGVFEAFNEPDDWHGSNRHWIHPAWFATILQQVYTAVKANSELADVQIVSGPVEGFERNGNAGARYLRNTYQEGKQRFGWGRHAPFPLDGVGYHLYIEQEPQETWMQQEAAIRRLYQEYVGGTLAEVRIAEGRDTPLYISEIGWPSNHGHEDFQAKSLAVGLNLIANDPSVKLGICFCLQDFGGEDDGQTYGLYRPGTITPENRKPAFTVFKALCDRAIDTEPRPIYYTNQDIINAFQAAAIELGFHQRWELLHRAGLWLSALAQDRSAVYTGPSVDLLPNLTDREKGILRRILQTQMSA